MVDELGYVISERIYDDENPKSHYVQDVEKITAFLKDVNEKSKDKFQRRNLNVFSLLDSYLEKQTNLS